MTTRLDTFASKLWLRITELPENSRRRIVLAACQHAINESETEEPLLLDAYNKLRSGTRLSSEMQTALKAKAEELDQRYLSITEDEGIDPDEIADMAKEANAAAALSFAADEDNIESAAECLYEASCTSFDDDSYWNMIQILTNELAHSK